MSNYLETQVLTHLLGTASYTKPSTIAVALCTTAPTDSSTGATIVEVPNSNSYARQTLNPSDSNWTISGGQVQNAVQIEFPAASGSWGTVTHVAILDSATHGAGNMLFHGALGASKTVGSGDILRISIGGITITLD